MTLSALLVCVDEAAGKVLRQVLEELSIQVEDCPDLVRAAIRLAQQRFDVVIVDGANNSEVIALLRESRQSRMNDSTLAVAVVDGQDSIREMFSLGVNFVLYKPVAHERALSSLRAARAVMRKEKRRSARHTVHAHATVDFANVQEEKATLVDLASEGMAVRFGRKLPPTSKVYFQFKLPTQRMSVRLSGQVVWQDWNGRAGVEFVDVPKASRKLIDEFLSASKPAEPGKDRLPDVTVEVEEPQFAAVSVAEETHGGGASAAPQRAADKSGAAADPDNRRGQARHSCRLGAEVYRTGTPVPHHCCLTDLSPGGCYLELSSPAPQGSSVEIVVRTHQVKLQLRGTVQASHPGYGMGVAFELNTKDERENVKKLNDMVAANSSK